MPKKHVHAELIKAWADGAQIQYLSNNEWYDADSVVIGWFEHMEYRIKPEPKPEMVLKVRWVIDGETGRIKSVELVDK